LKDIRGGSAGPLGRHHLSGLRRKKIVLEKKEKNANETNRRGGYGVDGKNQIVKERCKEIVRRARIRVKENEADTWGWHQWKGRSFYGL